MSIDTGEVRVAGTGKILVAPPGTAGPADHLVAWPTGWIDLGLSTDDGVTLTPGSDTTEITSWQLLHPVRRVLTSRTFEAGFTLQQLNGVNLPFAMGGGAVVEVAAVTGPPAIAAHFRYDFPGAGSVDERSLGIEFVDGTIVYRIVILKGAVSDVGDIPLKKDEEAKLELTFSMFGAASGAPAYVRTNDPSFDLAA